MRNNRKIPFLWKVEQYAFGAVALRNEIKRHKEEDKETWGIFKAIGIRVLYVYVIIATIVLVLWGSLLQGIQQFRH